MNEPAGSAERRGGTYAIHAEIASGGMATVHLGQLVGARGFARTVAIKVLHASYAKNKDFVARFVDEARLVGRIHHPNVMPTLDVIAEGDDLRIVMEYVAGESLDQLEALVIQRGARVPVRVSCAIIAGVLHGLHAAHEAKNEFGEPLGVVHLDVSPQNVLVGADGTTRVLDFGVARARGERANVSAGGKSAYLAPEQARGAEVTPRTDVFAASIVLWELLAGEPLFAADNHAATMQRVIACKVPSLRDRAPDVPAALEDVVQMGLRRDPGQRFATARDMALALEQAVPPALASEVGTWVESVAGTTLAARAAKVQEMEAAAANRRPLDPPGTALPGLVAPRALYAEEAAANRAEDAATRGSLLHSPPDAADLVPQRARDGSVVWKPRRPLPPRRIARPVPEDSPPRRRWLVWSALGAAALVLGLSSLVLRAMFLAGYVRSRVIDEAAAHGVALTVSEAETEGDEVLLKGLSVKLVGVPQVSATATSASVRVAWASPTRILFGKTEIAVNGDATATFLALDDWVSAERARTSKGVESGSPAQIELPSAHLVWARPGGTSIARVEASGLQGTIGSPTASAIGTEIHLLTNALVLETSVGGFGPWSLDVDATPKETRARLAFDPAVPDGANALLVDDVAGDTSLDLAIPRVAMAALGIPRTLLGRDASLPNQLEVAMHFARVNRGQATATLRAAFYGVGVPELGAAVDARVAGEATGPADGPMNVKNGTFGVGPVRGSVTGSITPGHRSIAAALSWKGEPVPCSSLLALPAPGAALRDVSRKLADDDMGNLGDLARDFGALGQAVGAVKVTGKFLAAGTVIVDSSDLSRTKFTSLTKNACGIALFQGK